jgi:hypothetical protein
VVLTEKREEWEVAVREEGMEYSAAEAVEGGWVEKTSEVLLLKPRRSERLPIAFCSSFSDTWRSGSDA